MGRVVESRMKSICRGWLALQLGLLVVPAHSQDAKLDEDVARLERLQQMKQLVDDVSLETGEQPSKILTRMQHPVLRYTNPVTAEFGEGVLFLWLDGKRPVAAVSPSFRHREAVYWELSSLSDSPLKLTRDGLEIWSPPSCSRVSSELTGTPPPAKSAPARLTQLRALARRFQVREERRGQWQEGRLLSQPLYRWEDQAAGIVDGALFGFAETTDPEILLLIEARREPEWQEAKWFYTLGKMTSSPMTVSLDSQQIWSVGGYWKNPRTPQDPYVEAQVATIRDGRIEYTRRARTNDK
jgi:hypothetical protein